MNAIPENVLAWAREVKRTDPMWLGEQTPAVADWILSLPQGDIARVEKRPHEMNVNELRGEIVSAAERLRDLRQHLATIQREAMRNSREAFDREIQAIIKGGSEKP